MISICIPIYNFNVNQLLDELAWQLSKIDVPGEIILIDDCSSIEYKNINESNCKNHTYIELNKNIGRAKIRNLFLDYVNFEHLLFLDCDVKIISRDFISNYVKKIQKGLKSIVCGGITYSHKKPERNKLLRWKNGVIRETQSIETRKRSPNKSFMTANFLIFKAIIKKVHFDERISGYGHEDTLFGFELKKQGITVYHIDNPVLIEDVEENSKFLEKTKKGITNLIKVLAYTGFDSDFIEDVTILNTYKKLNSLGLIGLINVGFTVSKPLLNKLLANGYVNLKLFDFYKIGILIQGFKQQNIKI